MMKKESSKLEKYVWKGPKREEGGKMVQEETRLIDAPEDKLKAFYAHCKSMLHSTDPKNPGRLMLLEQIKDQIARCNCELFLRWLEHEKGKLRFNFLTDIRTVLDNNKGTVDDKMPISVIVGGCPDEYKELPIDLVVQGCIDRLGWFNKKHITWAFILKQGLWFTSEELKDLTVKDAEGKTRDRVEVVKERLALKPSTPLFITPKGLTYEQLRAMVMLRSKRYSELASDQLKTLRNVVLFALGDEARYHIKQWEKRMAQIKEVADARGIAIE